MSSKYCIPKYLDEPKRLAIFTIDEVVVTVFGFVLGSILLNELSGMLLALVAGGSYGAFRRKGGEGCLQAKIYADYGFSTNLQRLPQSANKLFLG